MEYDGIFRGCLHSDCCGKLDKDPLVVLCAGVPGFGIVMTMLPSGLLLPASFAGIAGPFCFKI